MDIAVNTADALAAELTALPERAAAPTMGKLQKVRYTHDAMIDLIISNPWISQNEIAAHFGYSPSWISNVMASDAFQAKMASRREEVVNPAMKATIEEKFAALIHQSYERLKEKLEQSTVSPTVALKAMELGAKALGMGGHAPIVPPAPPADRLVILADKLQVLNPNKEYYYGKQISDSKQVEGERLSGGELPAAAIKTGGTPARIRFTPAGTVRADRLESSAAAQPDGGGI